MSDVLARCAKLLRMTESKDAEEARTAALMLAVEIQQYALVLLTPSIYRAINSGRGVQYRETSYVDVAYVACVVCRLGFEHNEMILSDGHSTTHAGEACSLFWKEG